MRIIALRGGDNCGKTETLTMVYNSVITSGGNSTNKQQIGADPRDFSDIVNYNGKTIAFFTMGDLSGATKLAISHYNTLNIDLLILVSNTKFTTPINHIMHYTHNLVPKSIANPINTTNNLTENTKDAKTIFGLI